ncbi:MAG TPA: NAD-dependent epimerase/dehydratase family protein [Spirochaetia bacterium]|nr:NAD-dependent epimerase/dehydratase family protein [Spirochaetia bacterium]
MSTKVTLTGSTGHVGIALANVLCERGYSVRAVIHRRTAGLEGLPVQKIEASLSDPESLRRAFSGSEIVFHAAAHISITRSDVAEVVKTNVTGTRNVIDACRAVGVRRLVHFSSIEAFSPLPLDATLDESRNLEDGRTGSPYALSKANAETEVRKAIDEGMDAVILNPTAVVGPFDYRPSLMGRALIAFATGGIPMLIDGGYDWVDVRDVAEGAVCAAERASRGSRYLLGGRWASMGEIARIICEVAGRKAPRLVCPYFVARLGAPVSSFFSLLFAKEPLFTGYSLGALRGNRLISHQRAHRELGYQPRDLEETARDTWRWFTEKGLVTLPAAMPREA